MDVRCGLPGAATFLGGTHHRGWPQLRRPVAQLAPPLENEAGRSNDERARQNALRIEDPQGADRLDRLAEPHLVGEQRAGSGQEMFDPGELEGEQRLRPGETEGFHRAGIGSAAQTSESAFSSAGAFSSSRSGVRSGVIGSTKTSSDFP